MSGRSPLGIIAGAGQLPAQLLAACHAEHRPVFVVLLDEAADDSAFHAVPHARLRLGAVGEAVARLREAGAHELVLAGGIKRPALSSLMPDALGAKLLARLSTKIFAGDDALLATVVGFLEEQGFRVLGADAVLSELLAPAGQLGKHAPDAQAEADIALACRTAHTLGALDIGQAVVAAEGRVLAVEAAEGTALLLKRCEAFRGEAARGVLVKMKKPSQERRVDLPSIGPETIAQAHAAGLAGVAVQAAQSLILGREETIAAADRLGLFLLGVPHG